MNSPSLSSRTRHLSFALLRPVCLAGLLLATILTAVSQSARAVQASPPILISFKASDIRSTADITAYVHLPILTKGGCAPIPGQTYGTLAPTIPRTDNVEEDHLINLALRSYEPVDESTGLVDNGPPGDLNAPQFRYLFADLRTPIFRTVYALHRWDSACDCPSPELVTHPPVSVAGLATTPGEIIHLPESGYDIGSGHDAMVLYASPTRLVAKYTREDDIVAGYTLYLENVCVEPALLALYQSLNAAGRSQLPALQGGQLLGRALGGEIGVSIRDSGTTQDPRSRNSWWLYP